MRLPRYLTVLASVAALAAAAPRLANARDQDELRRDEVRRAVEAGEIRSLADILDALRGKLPGEVAGVEIEHKDGRWRYEFRVVDSQGRLFEVYVDARSAEIERIKEK
ncbi:MAG TPA: PepSY domain-containing protein [Pseudolabrys sp.]